MAEKVRAWLEGIFQANRLRSNLRDSVGYVETPTAELIISTLKYVQMAGDIGIIYGGAGVGKTVCVKHYCRVVHNSWLCTATPIQGSKSQMPTLQLLAKMFNLPHQSTPSDLYDSLVSRVRDLDGLIIIDEAQHLPIHALDTVRSIHDETGVGLVLCGNETVYSTFSGRGRQANFAQLYSRVGKRVHISEPSKKDVLCILDAYQIGEGSVIRDRGVKIAQQHGGLRGLVKVLRLAYLIAGDNDLTVKYVSRAWKELGGSL